MGAIWNAGFPQTTFDQALVPGALDFTNWSIRWANQRYAFTGVGINPGTPTVVDSTPAAIPVPDVGKDSIDYTPPPFDVVSAGTGIPAVGFVGFDVFP